MRQTSILSKQLCGMFKLDILFLICRCVRAVIHAPITCRHCAVFASGHAHAESVRIGASPGDAPTPKSHLVETVTGRRDCASTRASVVVVLEATAPRRVIGRLACSLLGRVLHCSSHQIERGWDPQSFAPWHVVRNGWFRGPCMTAPNFSWGPHLEWPGRFLRKE
jgi:hypothetical protein